MNQPNGKNGNKLHGVFKLLGEEDSIAVGETYTVEKNMVYSYFPETLGKFPSTEVAEGQTMTGISNNSVARDMLFKVSGPPYFLASTAIEGGTGWVAWHIFNVNPGGLVNYQSLWHSNFSTEQPSTLMFGVRPVVSLKSDITPSFVSKDSTTNISTYEI